MILLIFQVSLFLSFPRKRESMILNLFYKPVGDRKSTILANSADPSAIVGDPEDYSSILELAKSNGNKLNHELIVTTASNNDLASILQPSNYAYYLHL